jgi:hypothetical protein
MDDEPGRQDRWQWAREWAAWHQRKDAEPGRQARFLAIGGLGPASGVLDAAVKVVAEAKRLLKLDFDGIPEMQWSALSWQQLYDGLSSKSRKDQPNSLLVQDLREILQYFGRRSYQFLSELSEVTPRFKIDAMALDVLARWDIGRKK